MASISAGDIKRRLETMMRKDHEFLILREPPVIFKYEVIFLNFLALIIGYYLAKIVFNYRKLQNERVVCEITIDHGLG